MQQTFDASVLTLKILSCIIRAEEKYGRYLIAATLCGGKSKKIQEFGLDKLSTYDIVKDLSVNQVQAVIQALMRQGFIIRSAEHGNLKITPAGKQFIKTKPRLELPVTILSDAMIPLFSRKLLATHFGTFTLWQRGLPISAIAQTRHLTESTIEGHLAELVYHGKIKDISGLISPDTEKMVRDIVEKHPSSKLREIKDQLTETITYGQIRYVVAYLTRSVRSL